MVVQWLTTSDTTSRSPQSYVRYSLSSDYNTGSKHTPQYTDATQQPFFALYRGRQQPFLIHTAVIRKLTSRTHYTYQVGSEEGSAWSCPFAFRSLPAPGDSTEPLRFVVFGDLGLVESVALPALIDSVRREEFDLAIHVGDIGYDLQTVGVEFLEAVEEMAAKVPYMVGGWLGN